MPEGNQDSGGGSILAIEGKAKAGRAQCYIGFSRRRDIGRSSQTMAEHAAGLLGAPFPVSAADVLFRLHVGFPISVSPLGPHQNAGLRPGGAGLRMLFTRSDGVTGDLSNPELVLGLLRSNRQ